MAQVRDDHADADPFDSEWWNYPLEKLFSTLRTSPRGLTSAVAAVRLRISGRNELEAKKQSKTLAYLPLAVEVAAVAAMAVGLARGAGHGAWGPAFIALLAAHFAVGFAESSRAAQSVAADLVARLAPSGRVFWVLRDDEWSAQDATALVLGDVIYIMSGDVVPVDARLLEVEDATELPPMIDQYALTGDPLLTAKGPGDAVYAGSTCAKGEAQAVVIAAGRVQTHLRKAVLTAITEATIGFNDCDFDLWFFGAFWNVSLQGVCFNFVADAFAGHIKRNDGGAMVVIACIFAFAGWALSMFSADRWGRRPGRDPKELVRRLEVLREQGKVSEETAQRCRDLLRVEPVCNELAAALASYHGRR